MSPYVFSRTPQYAENTVARGAAQLLKEVGVGRWSFPIASWRSPNGFDVEDDGDMGHHTISFIVGDDDGDGRVHGAVNGGPEGEIKGGGPAFSILVNGVPNHFWCTDAINFGHAYVDVAHARALSIELYGTRGDRPDVFRDDLPFVIDDDVHQGVQTYFRRAVASEGDVPLALEMDARATLIGISLVRNWSTLTGAPRAAVFAGGLSSRQINVAKAMMADFSHDPTLLELAAASGLSSAHFARAFKVSTGLPPHRWLIELRVAQAKALLLDTDQTVTEIAAAVGYDDPNQLARVFRAATGTSPSGWRRERRR